MEEPMEVMQQKTSESQKTMFDRVWKRVLEGNDGSSCPIAWDTETTEETVSATVPELIRTVEEEVGAVRSDFPNEAQSFWGDGCAELAPILQELVRQELVGFRSYQSIARRVGGVPARSLNALAADCKQHAKRLSALYFLLTGVRYWPEGAKATPPTSYLGALRQQFLHEQALMASYLSAAECTHDPCFRQLFFENARDAWEHTEKIRQLVEQA